VPRSRHCGMFHCAWPSPCLPSPSHLRGPRSLRRADQRATATTIRIPRRRAFWAWQWSGCAMACPSAAGRLEPARGHDRSGRVARAREQPLRHVDRPRHRARAPRRTHDPVRSDLLRAGLALPTLGPKRVVPLPIDIDDLPKGRRGDDFPQPLRPPRRGDRAQARRDAAGQPALPRATGPEALVRRPR